MAFDKAKEIVITKENASQLLLHEQHEYWKKLNHHLVEQLVDSFLLWPKLLEDEEDCSESGQIARHFVRFMLHDIEQLQQTLELMKVRFGAYSQRYNKAISQDEKITHMMQYARKIGATPKQLRGDRKALSRWFGHDALSDRYRHQFLETERYLSFVLQSLGRMAAFAIKENGEQSGYQLYWHWLALEDSIKPLLDYQGDKRVVEAAFNALTEAISAMPVEFQHDSISEESHRFIYHAALSSVHSIWVQCAALLLLQSSKPEVLLAVFKKRLEYPQPDDDLFVRRKVIDIIGQQLVVDSALVDLIPLALNDPSPSVRQKIPAALNQAKITEIESFYSKLLFEDKIEQVRASALLNLMVLMSRDDCLTIALSYLKQSLATEKQVFPLRVALKICCDALAQQTNKLEYVAFLLPEIEQLHLKCESLSIKRWAAQTREYLLCYSNDQSAQKIKELQRFVSYIPVGKTRKIPKELQIDDEQLGRLLSVIAQKDFGFDVEKGVFGHFLTRGHVFGFRIWRFLHEFRHPSPDKRQAFQHTRGRLFWGTLRVPSAILAELAETKVPGEPLYMDTEEGWRGYLPLVDEVISALAVGKKVTEFYHSEGLTQIVPPTNYWQRWKASWHISYYFIRFARLRNWREGSQESADSYIKALAELGVKISFNGHGSQSEKVWEAPSVLRFFPLALPVVDMKQWEEFKDYFISVYENTLYELSLFLGISFAYFTWRHIYLYQQIKKARNNIPLVLGGWGTRGKSGTERIKAALMNALGYSIISKTTGCEAMFLHSHPFGELKEMFLFRPYDKATIWEQHNLVCLTDKLNGEIFLWECMGLTPSYIDILQRQWMRDDIATITNTFPDHEDLQGPAGINIPEVMTQFIPESSTLITSEEQMLPILQVAAAERKTKFRSVGWLEAGLLADDVLERFPYDEHPFNIALVMAMGDELGVDGDYALKEMADRVIADIGVLKTYPVAPWRSRRLEFINGMSANERFGCLGNWQRMGLDKLSMDEHPDTWITTVVNNRADRIARSRVFASIIVKDISFDRCVLIGNNLSGFNSYVLESWQEWVATISLQSETESAEDILQRMAIRFRILYTEDLLKQHFKAMLQGQSIEIEIDGLIDLINQPELLEQKMLEHEFKYHQEILTFLTQAQHLFNSYADFLLLIKQTSTISDDMQQQFKELLWQWFEQKIVVVEDYYSTGNQVIERICDVSPPGFYNKILGMQNIKGTGLDFVYRWQAWESCYRANTQLLSRSAPESAKGLAAMSAIQEYGHLAIETVQQTIKQVKTSAIAQNERYQAELELISIYLEESVERLANSGGEEVASNTWLARLGQGIEAFLDAGDAVKRRKLADQIYKDLIDERISHDRAVLELQVLNKRQKGGWFKLDKKLNI